MLEDGVLEQIIEQYIQSSAVWCFDSVADMKSATNLVNGSYARTLGYYSANDGGESIYKITNTQSQTEHQETLNSGLYATLIVKDSVNIKQLGAYGDGNHNDTNAFKTFANSNIKTLIIPSGTYLLNDIVDLEKTLSGNNKMKNPV